MSTAIVAILAFVAFATVVLLVAFSTEKILNAIYWYTMESERIRNELKEFRERSQDKVNAIERDLAEIKNPWKEVNRILADINVTKMTTRSEESVDTVPSNDLSSATTAVVMVEETQPPVVSETKPAKKPRVRGPRPPRIRAIAKVKVSPAVAPVRRYSLESLEERVHHYRTGPLSNKDIGTQYERYIGYLFFTRGYHVFYNGIVKGEADDGIDLIAFSEEKDICWIVQTKCWSKKRHLHPKTFHQLKGSLEHYKSSFSIEGETRTVKGILVSTTTPTKEGNDAREAIGLSFKQQSWDRNHPIVKQTARFGKVFYKIPGDDGYDTCIVHGYFDTPSAAEAAGIPYWGNKELHEGEV